jgi:hypothetical protein
LFVALVRLSYAGAPIKWRRVCTVMLPDLRFLVGATLATALLAVASVGLLTADQIAHQARLGPLEASRSLAFAPELGRPPVADATPRFGMWLPDDPFATLSRGTAPDVVAAPKIEAPEIAVSEIVAQAPVLPAAPEIAAAPAEAPASPPDDTDTVDERAVIDPPLPADSDIMQTAEPDILQTAEPDLAPSPEVEHVGSLPPATAAAADPPIAPPPLVDTPATVAAADDAPVADADIVDTLGGALTTSAVPQGPAEKAKPEKKAKKAVAAKAKAKAKRTVRKARAAVQPTASSGYPIMFGTWPAQSQSASYNYNYRGNWP